MKKLIPILSFLTLVNCSDSSIQDIGNSVAVSVSGSSEDGYVAGATVWHDVNNDRALSSGEPSAKTDSEGYFSQSRTGTDYCAATATDAQKEHCLQIQVNPGETKEDVIIRAQGGIDILTGEDFVGSISIKTDVTSNGINNVVTTPITALLAHMTDAQALLFAQREGFTSVDELTVDFLEFTLGAGTDATENQARLMRSALQAHKTVELLNQVLLQRYTLIGEAGQPSDASDYVYSAFTSSFVNFINSTSTGDLNEFLTNANSTAAISFILSSADTLLRAQFAKNEKVAGTDYPINALDISTNTFISNLAAKSKQVNESIRDTMDIDNFATNSATNPLDKSKAYAKAKVVESIKETVIDKIETTNETTIDNIDFTTIDTQFSNAVKLAGDDNITDIFETAGDQLLISEFIAEIPTASSTFNTANIQTAVTNNTRNSGSILKDNLHGNGIVMQRNSGNESGVLILYFSSGESNNDGNLELCVKFDSDTTNQTSSADDTEGAYYKGTYKVSQNEYVVQLTVQIAGSPKNVTITSLGYAKSGGVEITPFKRRYRADYNGNANEWDPQIDLESYTVTPAQSVANGNFSSEVSFCQSKISNLSL